MLVAVMLVVVPQLLTAWARWSQAQSQQSMDMLYMLLAIGISYGTNCFITATLPSDSVTTQCYHILPNSTEFKIWPTSDQDGLVKM